MQADAGAEMKLLLYYRRNETARGASPSDAGRGGGSEAAGQMVEPPTKKRRLGPELNVLHALALHMQTFHPLAN